MWWPRRAVVVRTGPARAAPSVLSALAARSPRRPGLLGLAPARAALGGSPSARGYVRTYGCAVGWPGVVKAPQAPCRSSPSSPNAPDSHDANGKQGVWSVVLKIS
eukprot:scaffold80012_cov33-Tisochrysis_lutea.AAC.1